MTDLNAVARYIIDNKATVRQTAPVFGVSKSTVHRWMTKCLDGPLVPQVREVLDLNTELRALHGGEATAKKYKERREKMMKVETTATVNHICVLNDEQEKMVIECAKEMAQKYDDSDYKLYLSEAVEELYDEFKLDLYEHSVESDFCTESIDNVYEE